MELTCNQSDFKTTLSLVSKAVPSRPSHPILANVLLQADETTQSVKVTGFDLSLGIESIFPAQVAQGGKITLPSGLLEDIITRLPNGNVTIKYSPESENKTNLVNILSSCGSYQIRGLDASEFPQLPAITDSLPLQFSCKSILAGLKGVLSSASSDESKQVLTGIHLSPKSDGLEFAATDGHRLAVVNTANAIENKDIPEVTVPAKALAELIKLLNAHSEETVSVQADQSQITFELGSKRLTSRLLEGLYPNYAKLIPLQFTRKIKFDRKLFLGSLERVAVLAEQKSNVIKLSIESGLIPEVTLSVDAQDIGNAKETVPVEAAGDAMEIAFNSKYLVEAIKVMSTPTVEMMFNTPTSPTIIHPIDGDNMTCLIMPVEVRS